MLSTFDMPRPHPSSLASGQKALYIIDIKIRSAFANQIDSILTKLLVLKRLKISHNRIMEKFLCYDRLLLHENIFYLYHEY